MSKLWFFGGILAAIAVLVVFVGGVAAFTGKDNETITAPSVKNCQCGKDTACGGKCGSNCGCQTADKATGCGCAKESKTCETGCQKANKTCGCKQ